LIHYDKINYYTKLKDIKLEINGKYLKNMWVEKGRKLEELDKNITTDKFYI